MSQQKHDSIYDADDFPCLKESFSQQQRDDMIDDDMLVGRTVPLLLTFLVLLGLGLALIAVLVSA